MTNTKPLYIYIASPYTKGDAAENVRRSLEEAESIVQAGNIPFCPLLYHFWHFYNPHEYEFWIDLSKAWLKRCDALIRLPGESAGADAEVAIALEYGLKVYYK